MFDSLSIAKRHNSIFNESSQSYRNTIEHKEEIDENGRNSRI